MRFKKYIFTLAFFLGLLVPAYSYAAPENPQMCSKITDLSEKTTQQVQSAKTDFETRLETRTKSITDREADRDTKLQTLRSDADKNFDAQIAAVANNLVALPDVTALNDFKTTVETVRSDREVAFDKAIAAFRSALDTLLSTRKDAADEALTSFQTTMATALTSAETDCNAGAAPQTVRAELKGALQAARDNLKTSKNINTPLAPIIDELTKIRRKSATTALANYDLAIKKAVDVLEAKVPSLK